MNTEDDEFARIEREATRGVPDAIHHTDTSESLEYITGWNDCRQAMLAEQPSNQGKPMSIEPTNDKAAIVDRDYHWIDANEFAPPRGPKMLMIDKKLGVAVLGSWRDADGWTHWCPLPTFEKKK